MLHIQDAVFSLNPNKTLRIHQLSIQPGSCGVIIGNNGSGKTVLSRALNSELNCISGAFNSENTRSVLVSFEKQLALFDEEWERTNTDFLGAEEEIETSVRTLIQKEHQDQAFCDQLAAQFGIAHLLNQPFTALSSGEGRKVLLAQALIAKPDLLILDEPFDGLDSKARANLTTTLRILKQQGIALVLIVNRLDEIPDFADQLGWILNCEFQHFQTPDTFYQDSLTKQLMHIETTPAVELPPPLQNTLEKYQTNPLIDMKQIRVAYTDRTIIEGLDWQIRQGEHWRIAGPNGCGKTTLLHLITGDHPQCYANNIQLFGHQRGSGESIWDIKQAMGIVSPSLHMSYRVHASCLVVILSGFYDSIGLYQQPGDKELALARQWLQLLGMTHMENQAFLQLSYGQQRLLLVARALVKHPPLLILDEPLQGLDNLNRHLVLKYLDRLVSHSQTQLLYVSHHEDDLPACITHELQFVEDGVGHFNYQMTHRASH